MRIADIFVACEVDVSVADAFTYTVVSVVKDAIAEQVNLDQLPLALLILERPNNALPMDGDDVPSVAMSISIVLAPDAELKSHEATIT